MPPISNRDVKNRLETGLPGSTVSIEGDGYKYTATVVSPIFEGMSLLKRHKLVYAALNDAISSGDLHALTIKTFTPDEAAKP